MKTKKSILIIGLVAIAIVAAGTVIGVNLSTEKQKNQPASMVFYLSAEDHNTTVSMKQGESYATGLW
jgi:flagellar basal body-associated protein FliL